MIFTFPLFLDFLSKLLVGIILSEEVAKQKGKSLKDQLVNCWKEASSSPEYVPDKYIPPALSY